MNKQKTNQSTKHKKPYPKIEEQGSELTLIFFEREVSRVLNHQL